MRVLAENKYNQTAYFSFSNVLSKRERPTRCGSAYTLQESAAAVSKQIVMKGSRSHYWITACRIEDVDKRPYVINEALPVGLPQIFMKTLKP